MTERNNLQSEARKARRAKMKDQTGPMLTNINTLRTLLPENHSRRHSLRIVPYPSEIFPTDYNQRLPEWRRRASTSANKEHWKNWKEFQLAAMGAALGLSNVMYFPFYAADHGYGAFVYSYILVEFLFGYPILFLQMALGQFTSKDTVRVFSLVPLAQGVGISFALLSLLNVLASSLQQSWILFFAFSAFHMQFKPSFKWELPWQDCEWSDDEVAHLQECSGYNLTTFNATRDTFCPDKYHHDVITNSHGEDCYHSKILQFNWQLVGCLFVVYLLAFVILSKGIKTVGKVAIYAVPVACCCLVVILICVIGNSVSSQVAIKAALDGIGTFFKPEWSHLLDIQLWFLVIRHVMSSLNLDQGTMIVIGSYARFQSSTHYHAFYVCLADVALSLLAGVILHCFWNITLAKLGVDITDGFSPRHKGIQFHYYLTILQAIEDMESFSPFWVFIFFSTLLVLGHTSTVASCLLFFKAIDEFLPHLKNRRLLVNMVVFLTLFLLTVPFVTLGMYPPMRLLTLAWFNHIPNKYTGYIVIIISVSAFAYGYGLNRLRQDIDFMLQFKPNYFFVIMWISSPILMIGVVCADMVTSEQPSFNYFDSTEVPWMVFVGVLLPIPFTAVWNLVRYHRRGELAKLFFPEPALPWISTNAAGHEMSSQPESDRPTDARLRRQWALPLLPRGKSKVPGPVASQTSEISDVTSSSSTLLWKDTPVTSTRNRAMTTSSSVSRRDRSMTSPFITATKNESMASSTSTSRKDTPMTSTSSTSRKDRPMALSSNSMTEDRSRTSSYFTSRNSKESRH